MIDRIPKGTPKRAIDRLREGAGSTKVGTPDDENEITGFLTIDDLLYVVKKQGIYHCKLADEIDPERTNIGVPNTVQRILPYGSNDEWIGRTLLTGKELFNPSFLSPKIDCNRAMVLMLDIAKNVGAMKEEARIFLECEKQSIEALDPSIREDRSFVLPSVHDVDRHCANFLQKADHTLRNLQHIVRLFYGDNAKKGWPEAFAKFIEDHDEREDDFLKFLREITPFMHVIRNARNCVEHPQKNQLLKTEDFSINAKQELTPPMMEIVHPKTPQEPVPILAFMGSVSDSVVLVVEDMVSFLCGRFVSEFSGFPIVLCSFSQEMRKEQYVQYGYGTDIGSGITRIG